MSEPGLRAAITKTLLDHLARHDTVLEEAVRRRVDPEVLESIEALVAIAYLPIGHHLDVVDAIEQEIGAEGLQQLFAEVYLEGFSRLGALRGFLDATLRIFSADPMSLGRALPRAWASMSRDLGRFTAPERVSEQAFETRFVEFPEALLERPAWVWTFAGLIDGLLRHVGAEGRTTVDRDAWSDREVIFRAEWTRS